MEWGEPASGQHLARGPEKKGGRAHRDDSAPRIIIPSTSQPGFPFRPWVQTTRRPKLNAGAPQGLPGQNNTWRLRRGQPKSSIACGLGVSGPETGLACKGCSLGSSTSPRQGAQTGPVATALSPAPLLLLRSSHQGAGTGPKTASASQHPALRLQLLWPVHPL